MLLQSSVQEQTCNMQLPLNRNQTQPNMYVLDHAGRPTSGKHIGYVAIHSNAHPHLSGAYRMSDHTVPLICAKHEK